MPHLRRAVASSFSLGFLLTAVASAAQGQQRAAGPGHPFDSTGTGDTWLFAPLHLRGAKRFRAGSGAPGSHYWEQRADYDLKATLDTGTKMVTGQETIRYTNNS